MDHSSIDRSVYPYNQAFDKNRAHLSLHAFKELFGHGVLTIVLKASSNDDHSLCT